MKKTSYLSILLIFILLLSCNSESDDIIIDSNTKISNTVLFEGEINSSLTKNKSIALPSGCGVIGENCANRNQILSYTYFSSSPSTNTIWSIVSGDITIIRGQNTNTVTLNFGNNFSGGSVMVSGNGVLNCAVILQINNCGNGGTGSICDTYSPGISDNYLDGTLSGANFIHLEASGNFPSGTTYTWAIKYKNGNTRYYPASTDKSRRIFAAIKTDRIEKATVTAKYNNCEKTFSKTYDCPIPEHDEHGNLLPECGGNDGGSGFIGFVK
ncbi:hypothetical protein [uncultured Tenacibaculum sp.]|uniref:hypothetical protein n=1 Tax=uncultured Tenacibaculum sp. TaxID=174713 RepID=UPI00262C4B21|nr:hypothetical protein [uncultured Tenacibaculum sp.]